MTDQPGENPTEPFDEGNDQSAEGHSPPLAPETPPTPGTPPAAPSAPAAPAAAEGPQYDLGQTLQEAHRFDLGIVAAGVVAFIASMLPFYTVSVSAGPFGGASGSVSAWHGFFGWFAVLVALAAAVVVALSVFDVVTLPMPVHQIAVGGFALSLICLVLALFVDPSGGCNGAGSFGITCDIGRGFGYWLALVAVLAGTALSVLRMRESTGPAHSA